MKQPRAETDKEFMLSTHKLHIEATLDKGVSREITTYDCLFLRVVPTNTEVFLHSLLLCWKSRS